jgi:hypothetical protein
MLQNLQIPHFKCHVFFAAGNVFGVSLATLLERDQLIGVEDCEGVPLIFQKVQLKWNSVLEVCMG